MSKKKTWVIQKACVNGETGKKEWVDVDFFKTRAAAREAKARTYFGRGWRIVGV